MKKVSILERGGKAYKNYSKCWQSENTGKTVKSLWIVTNQVGTANAFHVLGFYLPRVPDVEGKGHNTTTPIRNPLVLVLLNFTLAYKYNYPRRYIEKQWTKKNFKIPSQWVARRNGWPAPLQSRPATKAVRPCKNHEPTTNYLRCLYLSPQLGFFKRKTLDDMTPPTALWDGRFSLDTRNLRTLLKHRIEV